MQNLGFNVFGREAMKNFLEEHNLQDLQQAIAEQKEIDTIKQKAIADGTFMKAPNGKPTNLNEKQWLQVRTTNFKKWFGDWEINPQNIDKYVDSYDHALEASKVLDENGEPLVVYHGSPEIFNTFNYEGDRQGSGGFFFTSDKNYAERIAKEKGDTVHVMPVFLKMINPIEPFEDLTWANIEQIHFYEQSAFIIEGRKYPSDGIIGHDKNTFDIEGLEPSKGTEYVVFRPNQIKSATDNNGNFSLTDNDIQAAFKIDNSNINDSLTDVDKEDILREVKKINRAKRTLIDTGGNFLFLVDHTDKEGLEYLQEGQEGFLCKAKIDITGLSGEQINEIKNNYEDDRGNNEATKGLEHWIERNGYSERYLNSDSIDAEDRASNSDNAGLDSQAQEGKSVRGQGAKNSPEDFGTGQIKTGFDGTNGPRYISREGVEYFLTPQGEVFGFVDKEGNIYLDETKITPEHPIHEYTHLWDRALQQRNPELWNRGVELMKQTSLWKELHRTHTRSIT